MLESFETLQEEAIAQLKTEKNTDTVVGSLDEATDLLLSTATSVTIVLDSTNRVDEIPSLLISKGIHNPSLKAWSRGNLPGVLVYDVSL